MIKDNILAIPIQLRPKDDDELQAWNSKLKKGKKEGEYFYKFGNETIIDNENKRKQIANIILNNINKGNDVNTPLDKNRKVYVEDIEKVLVINSTYKKEEKEHLYLQVKVQGKVSSHEKEFLNQNGNYFKIGGKCPRCEAEITISDFEQMFPNVKQLFYKGTNNFNNPDIKVFLEVLN